MGVDKPCFSPDEKDDAMRLRHIVSGLLAFLGVCYTLTATPATLLGQGTKKDPASSLEETYREWHKGFSSDEKENRIKALRSMFPTKEDVAYLFPKHVEKLWPKFEQERKRLEDNVDRNAKQVTKGGAITKIRTLDARSEKLTFESYRRLLEIIPKDVQVFDLVVSRANNSSGSGSYLFIKDRWFWIRDIEVFPEILKKLE
ncbi:MAG: hypothetical protein U0744_05655 [Gemmataceae bacterium]